MPSQPPPPTRQLLPAVHPRTVKAIRPIGPPASAILAPRKTHTTAACETCRKRKVKCNAARPACGYCVSAGVNCVYSTYSKNETHAQALKRKVSELSSRESTFQQIYKHLRDRPESETGEIVKRIRAGANPQSILRHITEGDLLLQLALVPETRYRYVFPMMREMPRFLIRPDNPYLNSRVFEWPSNNVSDIQLVPSEPQSPYEKPYHIAEVVDPLLTVVKPSEWTTVSSDDGLLRKLLALYFLHEYQWFPSLHKDYFLQDMAAGRRGFCSSLLVNIVLASGVRAYQSLPNRYEHWNPRNLGYQFLAEAKRLWEIELAGGRARLTTIQAAVLLDLVHIMNAMDAVGASYIRKALEMAQTMRLFALAGGPFQNLNTRKARAEGFTAWALFNYQSMSSYSVFEPPSLQTPPAIPLPDPATDPDWYGQIWVRYPLDPKLYTTHFPYQFKAQSEVRVIMNDNWVQQFSKGDSSVSLDSGHQANDFYSRLKEWYDNLPGPLTPARITFPSQLLLHIHYQNVVAKLSESDGNSPTPFQTTSSGSPTNPDPSQIRATAAQHFETLIRLYYLRHGFAHANTFIGKPLIQLGFMSLNKIQTITSANNERVEDASVAANIDITRSTLILAAKGVHDQGKNIYLAQVILRMLCAKMGPEEKDLVERVIGNGMDGGDNSDGMLGSGGNGNGARQGATGAEAQMREVRSRLLPSAVSFSEDPEVHRLGNLVSRQLRLDDEKGNEEDQGGDE